MITEEQIHFLSKKYKINESVILREYLQLFFLKELYSEKISKKIFFKGGTALHLIFDSPRFSEDLDFTVEIEEKTFDKFILKLFKKIGKKEAVRFRPKKTLIGKTFLLKNISPLFSNKIFIRLDFSFREKVVDPKKSIINTNFPILFTSYIYNLSKKEILAEKIRALLTRKKTKGRDFYDIWYLLTQNTEIDNRLINKKLKYYNLKLNKNDISKRIKDFSKKDFILDIRPFVPVNKRDGLGKLFDYIKKYLEQKLNF